METTKIFKQKAINNLKFNLEQLHKLILENNSSSKWLDKLITKEDFTSTIIDFSKVNFIISKNKSFDFENGLMLYSAFKDFDLTTLTDERFWVTLIFSKGYSYMLERWGNEDVNTLKYHWFFYTNQRRSITYHGLARLFWRVKVTFDGNNLENPFHLTKFAFDKPEILKNSMFRNFMFHENSRLGYLEAVHYLSSIKKFKIDDIYLTTKLMTKLASASLLDTYNRVQIKEMLIEEYLNFINLVDK